MLDHLRIQHHGDEDGTASQKAVRGSVSEGVSRVPDSAYHSCSHSPGQYLSLLHSLRHIGSTVSNYVDTFSYVYIFHFGRHFECVQKLVALRI